MTLQCASVSELFGGSVLAERIFSYPGLGSTAVEAGLHADAPLLMGIALFSVLFVFAGNLTDQAASYLNTMLLINAYYVWAQGVNTCWICGCFRAGGDTRWGMVCDIIDMWCFSVPLGFFVAFVLKLPVLWVYFILCLDEFVKIPFIVKHFRSFTWIRNITRSAEELS